LGLQIRPFKIAFKRVHYDTKFKLGKFLNIEEKQRNDEQKANLLVLELLHLLADGKRLLYFEKLERIEGYISSRFRAHIFKRTRYFLRLLKSIVKGNYHIPLARSLDIEIVPYELLWELALGLLRK